MRARAGNRGGRRGHRVRDPRQRARRTARAGARTSTRGIPVRPSACSPEFSPDSRFRRAFSATNRSPAVPCSGDEAAGADGRAHRRARTANSRRCAFEGGKLRAIDYTLPVPSAQVKTCVLFAGLYADGQTTVTEPVRSRDHTEIALREFGADIAVERQKITIAGRPRWTGRDLVVPSDLSSAAFFLVAALLVPGSQLTIHGVGLNPTRSALLDFLVGMGARIRVPNLESQNGELIGDLEVEYSELRGGTIDGGLTAALIDEIPVLAVLGAATEEGLTVRDAGELRIKETDRIRTVVENLRLMGVEAEELPDGMVIPGRQKFHAANARFLRRSSHRHGVRGSGALQATASPRSRARKRRRYRSRNSGTRWPVHGVKHAFCGHEWAARSTRQKPMHADEKPIRVDVSYLRVCIRQGPSMAKSFSCFPRKFQNQRIERNGLLNIAPNQFRDLVHQFHRFANPGKLNHPGRAFPDRGGYPGCGSRRCLRAAASDRAAARRAPSGRNRACRSCCGRWLPIPESNWRRARRRRPLWQQQQHGGAALVVISRSSETATPGLPAASAMRRSGWSSARALTNSRISSARAARTETARRASGWWAADRRRSPRS
jgi:hypothetical protein